MQEIKVHITNRVAWTDPGAYIVADNDEWIIKFLFDNEWDNFESKAARVFIGEEYYTAWFENNEITLPRLPQDKANIGVGVFAYEDEERVVFSSTVVSIPVYKSALNDEGGAFVPVDPAIIPPADSVATTDTLIINKVASGTKALATIQQILDLVSTSGVTMEQLRQALGYYRMASDQDIIDGNLADAINAKYTLPQTGIPKNELSSGVQSSLDKADTALQSAPVSSVNNKTGEVTLSASDVNAEPAITEVTVSTAGAVTQALDAGKIYHFAGALTSLTLTFNAASGIAQYHFDFTEGSTAFAPTLPNGVKLPDNHTWEADTRYEVDILNNYAVIVGWAVS